MNRSCNAIYYNLMCLRAIFYWNKLKCVPHFSSTCVKDSEWIYFEEPTFGHSRMKRALSRLSGMRMASRLRIDQDWIVTPKSKDIRKFPAGYAKNSGGIKRNPPLPDPRRRFMRGLSKPPHRRYLNGTYCLDVRFSRLSSLLHPCPLRLLSQFYLFYFRAH